MSIPYEVDRLMDSASRHVEDAVSDLREIVNLSHASAGDFSEIERRLRDLQDIEHWLRYR